MCPFEKRKYHYHGNKGQWKHETLGGQRTAQRLY